MRLAIIICIGSIFLSKTVFSIQDMNNDTPSDLLENWRNEGLADSTRFLAVHELVWSHFYRMPDSALVYAKEQYAEAKAKGSVYWMAKSANNLASIYGYTGEFIKSLDSYKICLSHWMTLGDKGAMGLVLSRIGMVHRELGEFSIAVDYLYKGMKMQEESGELKGIADSENFLGVLYSDMGELDSALAHYERGLQIAIAEDNQQFCSFVYGNLGNLYAELGDYPKSFENFEKGKLIQQSVGDTMALIKTYQNIGQNYLDLGSLDSAMSVFEEGLQIAEGFFDGNWALWMQVGIAQTQTSKGNYSEALAYCKTVLPEFLASGDLIRARDIYWMSYECYQGLGQHQKALENYESFISFRDSIVDQDDIRSALNLEYGYQYEKLAFTDSLKRAETKKVADAQLISQKAQIEEGRTVRAALILGIILLTTIVLLVLRSRRVVRKQKLVVEQNEMLLLHQKESLHKELINTNKELTNFALNLVQRNDFLEKMKADLLKNSRASSDDAVRGNLQEMSIMVHQYTSNNAEDEEFRKKLEEHNANFYRDLEKKLPDLSGKEKHLCALIRLGLSSKEIASVANIAHKSVNMNRYRLRQKLGINTKEGLHEFMLNI